MTIKVSPFIDINRKDNWNPKFPVAEFDELRLAFRERHGEAIGIMVAADGILAEIVRRSMSDMPSIGDHIGRAGMWDVRKIVEDFEFELNELTFADLTAVLEGSGYLTFDSPPDEVPEPYAFAYLEPAGLERGSALLGLYFGTLEFAPAADRVVTLDHNSKAIVEIRDQLTEIAQAVKVSNSVKLESGSERDRLREQLIAGSQLFTVQNVSVAAVSATAVAALKYLTTAFADEALGRLAGSTLDAILKALGFA